MARACEWENGGQRDCGAWVMRAGAVEVMEEKTKAKGLLAVFVIRV